MTPVRHFVKLYRRFTVIDQVAILCLMTRTNLRFKSILYEQLSGPAVYSC
jgi:hypothetical protein